MKIIYCIAFCLLMGNIGYSQILKKVLNDAKNHAESKVRSKAIQKTDQAIDSLLMPSQKTDKKSKENSKPSATESATQTAAINSSSKNKEEEMNIGEGFIKLYLSANEVFKGGTVIVTGNSIKYGDLKTVKMTVTGKGKNETETLTLYENGSFAKGWLAEETGEFTITIKSSDGKDQQSEKVKVYDMEVTDDWRGDNKKEAQMTFDLLKKRVEEVKEKIADKDKAELDKKLNEIEENLTLLMDFFSEMNNAIKELGRIKAPLPAAIKDNFSKLNDLFWKQRQDMQILREAANHQPYDNTVCEYLVMVNEAAQAFTTISGPGMKIVKTYITKSRQAEEVTKGPAANLFKPLDKVLGTSEIKAEKLASRIGATGFAGSVVQYSSEYLMKKYCASFSGDIKHDYMIVYRNKDGLTWWKYNYQTEGILTLRYPKGQTGAGIIKMKGNIEGNATKFTFFQDIEQMDDFKDQMKNRAKLTAIELYKPPTVPFSTSKNDVAGFGAIARGLVTPAYFNIPIDAEYDTETEKIKIFLNDPIIDFTPFVRYTYGYIAIAAGIPLVTRVDFPVNKAKLTLNAVVSKNNEFEMEKSSKNEPWFRGNGTREIGTSTTAIEHKINFSLSIKSQ